MIDDKAPDLQKQLTLKHLDLLRNDVAMDSPPLTPRSGSDAYTKGGQVWNFGETALDSLLKICIAVGVFLRFLWMGKRELWYDEVLSLLFAAGQKNSYRLPDNVPFSLSDFSPLLRLPPEEGILGSVETVKTLIKSDLSEPHPPLVYLSAHGWIRIFGTSEAALRSLMVVMSVLALVAAYFVGRRLLGQRGGLIFTALLALNPFFFSHSLNLRMYSPLVLWALVSGLCLLVLMGVDRSAAEGKDTRPVGWRLWLCRAGMATSLTAGLLTQYLFGYWFFSLAALVLYLDRKHWFQHGVNILAGFVLFLPWGLWGTLKQINNRRDVLNRLSADTGPLQSALQHGRDVAQTLANYLLLGHLTTGMEPLGEPIKPMAVAIGCGVVGFVVMCIFTLYRRQRWVLIACGLLGLFPLMLALGVDVMGGKNTLGFGWGRATIVVLPGCVLLVAAWLEVTTGRWRGWLTAGILAVYMAVNVGDFGWRDRQMFNALNQTLLADDVPTLVAMNSRAWGHVQRLVYYLDEDANPDLLATDPAKLATALDKALDEKPYRRVLWFKSNYPLWRQPETEAEAIAFTTATDNVLQADYSLQSSQSLRGTMNLDSFELQVYRR